MDETESVMLSLDSLPLPESVPPELSMTWREFRSNLEFLAPGVVTFRLADEWKDSDNFLAAREVCAILIPGFVEELVDSARRPDCVGRMHS
jgi:hypothetical protein